MENKEDLLSELRQSWVGEIFTLSEEDVDKYLKMNSFSIEELRRQSVLTGAYPIQKLCDLTNLQKHIMAYAIKCEADLKRFLEVNNITGTLKLKHVDVSVLNKTKVLGVPPSILPDIAYSLSVPKYPDKNIAVYASGVYEVKYVSKFSGRIYNFSY